MVDDWVLVLLKLWGAWTHDGKDIRKMTGCGPGSLAEAGPPARRGVYGEPEAGEVWEDDPVRLVDVSELEAVDAAIRQLTPHLAAIIGAEYRIRGRMTQAEKAAGLCISHDSYRDGLRTARRKVALMLG